MAAVIEEDLIMQLTFLGKPYEASFPVLEATDTEVTGLIG
jgi:hypothetical protein